jgi:hypothetical protein
MRQFVLRGSTPRVFNGRLRAVPRHPIPSRTVLRTILFSVAAGISIACRADVFVREDIITDPDPTRFNICYDNGCASLAQAALSAEQWQRVVAAFVAPVDTAAEERERIRTAIALFETMVGPMTGTAGDKGGNLEGFGLPGQMDCIDESTNTTIYLRMLQKYGLLRWHKVADRATRWSLFSWPHTTAVIEELDSGARWVVDSWFLDNGEPPFVLPLDAWRKGWRPSPGAPVRSTSLPDDSTK